METHYTKKASAYIMKAVLKENPKASKLTTFDEAFVLLMDKWDLEGSIETDKNNNTVFQLYRDNEVIKTFTWKNVWLEKEGDWDWNLIYKDVLETILKTRLYKKPKLGKRAQAKLEKEKAEKKAQESKAIAEAKAKEAEENKIAEAKDQIRKLKMRIYQWTRKGKDASELESQLKELNDIINRAKPAQISIQTKKVSKSVKAEKETVKSTKNKKSCKKVKSIK